MARDHSSSRSRRVFEPVVVGDVETFLSARRTAAERAVFPPAGSEDGGQVGEPGPDSLSGTPDVTAPAAASEEHASESNAPGSNAAESNAAGSNAAGSNAAGSNAAGSNAAEPVSEAAVAEEAVADELVVDEPVAEEPGASVALAAPAADAPTDVHAADDESPAEIDQPPAAHDATFAGADEDFSEAIYLALNPDVAAAVARGDLANGRQHWDLYGKSEDRLEKPKILLEGEYEGVPTPEPWHANADAFDDLDPESYMYLYADIRASVGGDAAAARQHWLDFGRREGRIPAGFPPFRDRAVNPGRLLSKPFGINAYGAFTAVSGLGVAARAMMAAIEAAGIPVEVWNLDTSRGPARAAARDRARAPRYRINLLMMNADHLRHTIDLFEPGHFDDAYNIGVWQWELASFRPDWFPFFGAVDEVWTNSRFQVDSIRASSPVPVVNIHLPVRRPLAIQGNGRDRFGIPDDRFVFLLPFDVSSSARRKNPFAAIKAFRDAFSRDENVLLVLKYHSQRNDPGFITELNRSLRGAPNIMLIAEQLSDADMAALRHACDCLVSPHRSEGYGLNIAEALAAGKPVIATNYSGNVDFFDESVGFPIDYKLTEVEAWSGPYVPGYIWAEPQVGSIATQMRLVFEDRGEARRRATRGAARMAAAFTPAAIGARILGRLRDIGLDAAPVPFLGWIGSSRHAALITPGRRDPARAGAMAGLHRLPQLSVIVPVYNVPGHLLRACIESVIAQEYGFWDLCLCDDGSTRADTLQVLESYRGVSPKIKIRTLERNQGIAGASNGAVEMAVGEFVVMLDNDDILTPDALLEIARALNDKPDIDCLYSDEDRVDESGALLDHFYKPDWSPEHLESVMYVLHPLVVRKRLFLELGGFRPAFSGAQDYDLMLRCARRTDRIHHIPKVLYHWRAIPGSAASAVDAKPHALEAGLAALRDHVAQKYAGRAHAEAGLLPGVFRVRHQVPQNQRITLLILTNNARISLPGRPDMPMVDNFVDSIIERTRHQAYEIVVVDNDSLTPRQITRFAALNVRVENFVFENGFNFSAKANFAVRQARSELIVLLNDDMEVLDGDWLTALAEMLQEPDIGAVGARLLHADRTLQHVGIVLGVNGGAAHPYHCYPGDFVGYNAFTHIIRNYSAVTAACLATRRSVIAQVGGFDERFAVDYNDVDLCLRIREAGYRIVYQPHAELLHFEGQSARRTTQNASEVALFVERWNEVIANDPFYNPNLTRSALDFSVDPGRREALAHAAE